MENKEFIVALNAITEEKGIDKEIILDAMKTALSTAFRKTYNHADNVRVDINDVTGEIKVFSFYNVVEEINEEDELEEENENYVFDSSEITLAQAYEINPDLKVGDYYEKEETTEEFGRIAIGTAKQVVMQKIREAERQMVFEHYIGNLNNIITGTVSREDQRNYYIDLGRTDGILPKNEVIKGEVLLPNQKVKAYLSKVENNPKGSLLILSRTDANFIVKLLEQEVPELASGELEVVSFAREAGERTKIVLRTNDDNIDPIGTCIGVKGSRIKNIIEEINDEKIDLIEYSEDTATSIIRSLTPAKVIDIIIDDEENRYSTAIVSNEELSVAIGRRGKNVRLAARLTGWKIDIKTLDEL